MTAPTPSGSDEAVLRALVEVSSDGLAVLDGEGRVLAHNTAAAHILGVDADRLVGRTAPFDPGDLSPPVGSGRRRMVWYAPNGRRRDLEYRGSRIAEGTYAVWFNDMTEVVRQQERLTAITRAASSVAEAGSLRATLDAVAHEVHMTTTIAAVQILAVENADEELRVLGMSGFGDADDFTERFRECRRLGARVRFIDAIRGVKPVVVLHRKPAVMADPAWAPLHEIMGRPAWDSFACMPLVVRGRAVGVINAFYVPGEDPGPRSLHFLEAMADHAAVAIDTAMLLAQTRSQAQLYERRRLARDLHDSVVQQVFSMRMQAKALRVQLDGEHVDPARMRNTAEELAELSDNALADLRGLVFELRPLDLADRGLVAAVREHAASVEARAGVHVEVHAPADLSVGREAEEDLYRIVQEALHNVVKHARATRVDIRFGVPADTPGGLAVEVTDDGCGRSPENGAPPVTRPRRSLGLVSMRERVQHWGGRLTAGPRPTGGWAVEVMLPAGDERPRTGKEAYR
ncbi:MAG: histidine kinase [Actinomycetes bacterium]